MNEQLVAGSTDEEVSAKRKQVADQYRVVAYLAKQIAKVHEEMAALHDGGYADRILDMVGKDTAARMELLGDMLNEMAAVDEEDAWTAPIFAEAQKRWPTT